MRGGGLWIDFHKVQVFQKHTGCAMFLWVHVCAGSITILLVLQASRVTPAMEAGITDHVWSLEEIVNLLA
jgi:hypothetical protein